MGKIAVIGLGIIGGSICASLSKTGRQVYGYDIDENVIKQAIQKQYIVDKAQDFSVFDVVFVALPPKATLFTLDTFAFKDGALVMDICGVKKPIEELVYLKERNYRYVGLHPMAGKESSGLNFASHTLFAGANLVVTVARQTDEHALEQAVALARELGFSSIIRCSAEEHDRKIALTSQLAHLVSNAYVKSPETVGCEPFTGGSFQDMTRIAGVDESVWTQLYMLNAQNIADELELLIGHLQEYKTAILADDEKGLAALLKDGREVREKIKRKNN